MATTNVSPVFRAVIAEWCRREAQGRRHGLVTSQRDLLVGRSRRHSHRGTSSEAIYLDSYEPQPRNVVARLDRRGEKSNSHFIACQDIARHGTALGYGPRFRTRSGQHGEFGRRRRGVRAAGSNRGSGGGEEDADVSEESDPEAVALTMSRLERELDAAVQAEDYAAAAALRDRLRRLQSDNEAAVIAANVLFYRAFGSADLRLMRRVWARGEHVQCIHPGANTISGYDMVLNSWELIFDGMNRQLSITLDDVACHVRGSMAVVTCVEIIKSAGSAGRVVATNVFEKVGSQWLLCCHQGAPAPQPGRRMGL